jgi:DNA-binding transcriptional ArsR family regulator
MPRKQPTVLARRIWGKRVSIRVKVDSGNELRDEISAVRKALGSRALSELFLLVAKGTNIPTDISRLTGKSKFAVSLQLSKLKKVGLLKDRSVIGWDMRRKRYEIVWEKVAQIFRQDHALEFEMYENHLILEPTVEFQGTMGKPSLVILGNGKLGLVREVVADDGLTVVEEKREKAFERMSWLDWEFVELFKGYLKTRRFATLQEYLLGAYEELSEYYGRLPKNSELKVFFEFMDRSFTRIEPIEQLWRKYVGKKQKPSLSLHLRLTSRTLSVKLFTEAGSSDPAGRYLLNANAQAVIKPGTPLKIYPSYTYPEP